MGDKEKEPKIILLGKFNSIGEAHSAVEKDFLTLVSLLRANRYICDEKLEIRYNKDERGLICGRYYFGKVKFSESTIVEDEDEGDILVGNFIVVLRYSLNEPNLPKKTRTGGDKKGLEKKVWVLQKHVL